jgi:hypothetical protein
MIDTLTLVGSCAATFVSGGGIALLTKAYATKRAHDSKDHAIDVAASQTAISTLVELLRNEQTSHNHTRDRLSAANTEIDLRGGQVGDLGARVELLEKRDAEREARVLKLDERNDDCERRNAALARRVYLLERNRVTPVNDTPAVMPFQHEEVGGHE